MQLKRFTISGLFGRFTHSIGFPVSAAERGSASVVILHGLNGVGKTTLLRMLDGILRLDFNPFRRVPFDRCTLEFDNDEKLDVLPMRQERLKYLEVSYRNQSVRLHPQKSGACVESDASLVESFRESFFKGVEDITFDFIDTERLYQLQSEDDEFEYISPVRRALPPRSMIVRNQPINPKARAADRHQNLATKVRRFIRDAQVNYRRFFSTTEPELFPRIIERLASDEQPKYEITDLRKRLDQVRSKDEVTNRFGLESDRWDYVTLVKTLEGLAVWQEGRREQALTVLGSYVEQLESRAAQRALVADRLITFERLMGDFLGDKTVLVEAREGIRIKTDSGETLDERQLSSGEFHLLYLMVAALATRRRGTVVAIDEPEMSMHIAWQRKLIPALLECASKAEPLFIFATHSPDLAASLPDALIELK